MDKKGSYISIPEKIIMFLVAFMSAVVMCGIVYNLRELTFVNEKYTPFLFCACAVFSISFLLLIKKWFGIIDGLSKNRQIVITVVLFLVQFVISIWLFACIDYRPNTDSLTDIDTGWFMKDNVLDDANSHVKWLKMYPNNYFLILVFKGLAVVGDQIGATNITGYLWLVNYFLLFIGIVLAFMCACELSGHKKANKVLSLIVLNPIYYYLAFWVYSSSMSVPLLMGICYVLLKLYHEEKNIRKAGLCLALSVLIILGFQVRVTAVFPVVAFVVIRVLDLFTADKKELGKKEIGARILFALGVMIISFAGIKGINSRISDIFGQYQEYNLPTTRWIFVGSHGDGSVKTEYEDNGFDYSRLFGKDKEEKSKIYVEGIIYNYKRLGIAGMAKLFANKLRVTFSDAFPSVVSRAYSGIYSGQVFEILRGDVGEFFAYIYRIIIIFGIFLCAVFCMKSWGDTDRRVSLFVITMFGEMLFYLFWEVKGDYADSLLLLMALICAMGIDRTPCVKKYTDNRIVRVLGIAVTCAISVAMFVIMTSNAKFTHNRINGDTYSRSDDVLSLEVNDRDVLRQTFYSDDAFDKITIRAEAEEKTSDYVVSLSDESGNILYEKTFDSGDIKKGKLKLDMDDVVPVSKGSKYQLEIRKDGTEGANIQFFTGDNYFIDSYDGSLIVGDESYVDDLSMKVEYSGEGPFMPFGYAFVICTVCAALSIFGLYQIEEV